MYLSSRVTACVCLAAVFFSHAAEAELAARPAFAGIRPTIVTRGARIPYSGVAPTIVGRRDGYPGAGIRPTIVTRDRRVRGYGYGYGGGGLGYDGTANADFDGPSIYPLAPGAPGALGAPPPFAFPAVPAPCPQIIEIGGGLAHKAKTHVVFGSPCRR